MRKINSEVRPVTVIYFHTGIFISKLTGAKIKSTRIR